MKNIYEVPEINIVSFAAKDIITTSGGGNAILPDDEFGDNGGGGNAVLPDDEF
jgi:hypothetical protein